jgi:hypothetical protein
MEQVDFLCWQAAAHLCSESFDKCMETFLLAFTRLFDLLGDELIDKDFFYRIVCGLDYLYGIQAIQAEAGITTTKTVSILLARCKSIAFSSFTYIIWQLDTQFRSAETARRPFLNTQQAAAS